MMISAPPQTPPSKVLSSATNILAYPSPSLSPVASFSSVIEPSADTGRKSSVKSLMASVNPPASPLDALVMALEATAEEIKYQFTQDQTVRFAPAVQDNEEEEEEDPNATVPSSPTLFMKRVHTSDHNAVPSLHQLPSLLLPEAVFPRLSSPSSQDTSANLTPSTLPGQINSQRKLSISSQGSVNSVTSFDSNGEHRKTFACSVGNCEKKFSQVAHLRIHERCHTGARPFRARLVPMPDRRKDDFVLILRKQSHVKRVLISFPRPVKEPSGLQFLELI
ncbi:hypothetical protein BGZ46_002555 [Entomortierella lignicola]|nr:hypothetical protein BGZ46_002555 [Entomortierella lignicola]